MVRKSIFWEEGIASGRVRFYVLLFIRLMLVLAIFVGLFYNRRLVLLMSVVGLFVTFIPVLAKKILGISIPSEVEVIVLFFMYGILLYGDVHGSYMGFWWWDLLLNFGSACILGFVGLTLFYVFESEEIVEASPFVVVFFTFCFAFSIGGLLEIFEFLVDIVLGTGLQGGSISIMIDLMVNAVGALLISGIGYSHVRSGKKSMVSFLLSNLLKKNMRFLRSKRYFEYSSHLIDKLTVRGEGESLEFKSTLRKNLHTDKMDKNIEHAVLKTIVGFLNSNGGTLLVGVNDSGKVLGLEADDFVSHDKLKLYMTGMIKNDIGGSFLHYINFELYPYHDRHVLKVDCSPSHKRVFLDWNGEEEFYVRHGASTMKLAGNDLIDYVNERFGK